MKQPINCGGMPRTGQQAFACPDSLLNNFASQNWNLVSYYVFAFRRNLFRLGSMEPFCSVFVVDMELSEKLSRFPQRHPRTLKPSTQSCCSKKRRNRSSVNARLRTGRKLQFYEQKQQKQFWGLPLPTRPTTMGY